MQTIQTALAILMTTASGALLLATMVKTSEKPEEVEVEKKTITVRSYQRIVN